MSDNKLVETTENNNLETENNPDLVVEQKRLSLIHISEPTRPY